MSYAAPSCDSDFIKSFRDAFIKKMSRIQQFWPICGSGTCDFTNLGIKCSTPKRKRRATGGAASTIVVEIPVNGTNQANATEQLESGLKNNGFNLTITVNNTVINSTDNQITPAVKTTCPKGSILQSTANKTCGKNLGFSINLIV